MLLLQFLPEPLLIPKISLNQVGLFQDERDSAIDLRQRSNCRIAL